MRTLWIVLALIISPLMLPAQVAIRGEKVHTAAGPAIADGVVIIRDGKVQQVGPFSQVRVPAGYRLLQAKVVTPGLIDAHTVVGLSGYLNQTHDQRSTLTIRRSGWWSGCGVTALPPCTLGTGQVCWFPARL